MPGVCVRLEGRLCSSVRSTLRHSPGGQRLSSGPYRPSAASNEVWSRLVHSPMSATALTRLVDATFHGKHATNAKPPPKRLKKVVKIAPRAIYSTRTI